MLSAAKLDLTHEVSRLKRRSDEREEQVKRLLRLLEEKVCPSQRARRMSFLAVAPQRRPRSGPASSHVPGYLTNVWATLLWRLRHSGFGFSARPRTGVMLLGARLFRMLMDSCIAISSDIIQISSSRTKPSQKWARPCETQSARAPLHAHRSKRSHSIMAGAHDHVHLKAVR